VARAIDHAEPVAQAPHIATHALPVVKAPRAVEEPVRTAVKTAPLAPTSGKLPNADWLVMLSPEEVEADNAGKAKPAPAPKPKPYAKSQRDLEEYVMRKSSDPYSNLK
jgi:hypothetical protein